MHTPTRRHTSTAAQPKNGEVDDFLTALAHPLKPRMVALRLAIAALDARIVASIKWKAPSFALDDHFATFRIAPKGAVQLIFHLGTIPRPDATIRAAISDPQHVLDWKAADRAVVDLAHATEPQIIALLAQWISYLDQQTPAG